MIVSFFDINNLSIRNSYKLNIASVFIYIFVLVIKGTSETFVPGGQNKMDKLKPTPEAISEALKNPNGWVYVIDKAFEDIEEVPREAIKGAWKVNDKAIITDEFVSNPNYKNLSNLNNAKRYRK